MPDPYPPDAGFKETDMATIEITKFSRFFGVTAPTTFERGIERPLKPMACSRFAGVHQLDYEGIDESTDFRTITLQCFDLAFQYEATIEMAQTWLHAKTVAEENTRNLLCNRGGDWAAFDIQTADAVVRSTVMSVEQNAHGENIIRCWYREDLS